MILCTYSTLLNYVHKPCTHYVSMPSSPYLPPFISYFSRNSSIHFISFKLYSFSRIFIFFSLSSFPFNLFRLANRIPLSKQLRLSYVKLDYIYTQISVQKKNATSFFFFWQSFLNDGSFVCSNVNVGYGEQTQYRAGSRAHKGSLAHNGLLSWYGQRLVARDARRRYKVRSRGCDRRASRAWF